VSEITPRLLFVHAHPDDESSKGAPTAAKYGRAGARVVLVCATDGSAGDVLNPNHPDVDPADMPALRERELDAAVEIIGFDEVYRLGFVDSGLPDDPSDVPPGCFADRPLDEVAAPLADVLRDERPHVVVTYAPDGGYPHPDHIRVHAATMRALELAAEPDDGWRVPRTVFGAGFPRVRLEAIHQAMLDRGLESPFASWLDNREERDADRPHDVAVDVRDLFHVRDDALRAHASQVDPEGQWFDMPRDVEAEVWPWETYVILDGKPAPEGADDLFAGLDLTD
jgi:mycothiol S-conjugate amidase